MRSKTMHELTEPHTEPPLGTGFNHNPPHTDFPHGISNYSECHFRFANSQPI